MYNRFMRLPDGENFHVSLLHRMAGRVIRRMVDASLSVSVAVRRSAAGQFIVASKEYADELRTIANAPRRELAAGDGASWVG